MNDGKICVSVCAETADELIQQIERAESLADVIELRFDCLPPDEIKILIENLPRIAKTYLATFRPKEQGGSRELSSSERLEFWESFFRSNIRKDFAADFEIDLNFAEESKETLTIVSSHDFSGTPETLPATYETLSASDADVLKIAAQADDIADTIAVWKLLDKARRDGKQIVPIAMGEAGKWTRVLGLAHGAFMSYAALQPGRETASGQITVRDLIETYRARELNEQTEIYGIVGNPVSHSLSPYMHNAAFKFHNLNAVYIPFEIKNLGAFVEKFISTETREVELNFKGFSVTLPHKTEIIKHLDSIDETARAIGAVNTVKIADGKLHGSNTDAHGFIEPLRNAYGNLQNARVAILGNGGAARACIYALKQENADVVIFARDVEKSKILAAEFGAAQADLESEISSLKSFDIIVNATPLGTRGALENETPATAKHLENANLVYDLVYNPFETRLIKEARKIGVPTLGGLAMLAAQGAKQFEIWTGQSAPVAAMSAAALRELK